MRANILKLCPMNSSCRALKVVNLNLISESIDLFYASGVCNGWKQELLIQGSYNMVQLQKESHLRALVLSSDFSALVSSEN